MLINRLFSKSKKLIWLKKYLIIFLIFFYIQNTFAQDDNSIISSIDTTNLNAYYWIYNSANEKSYSFLDTSLNKVQLCEPYFENSFYNFHLGGVLNPSLSAFFENQNKNLDEFIFFNYNKHNFTTPEEVQYYNTTKPYTDFFYSSFPNKLFGSLMEKIPNEQLLKFIHTQNINSKTNIGVRYNYYTEEDIAVKDQNSSCNSLILWGEYAGSIYSMHANIIANKLKSIENGGIIDTTTTYDDYTDWTFFLSESRSRKTDNYFYLTQEYKLGVTEIEAINDTTFKENFIEKAVLSHTLKFESSFFKYTEDNANQVFYDSIYIDELQTSDSTHFGKLTNVIQLKSKKYEILGLKLNGRIALSNDIYKLYNFKGYFSKNKADFKTSTYLIAGINNFTINNLTSNFDLQYCLVGYNFADLKFDANLQKLFSLKSDSVYLTLDFNYQHTEPSFFIQNYFSNHNFWNNDFKKQKNISLSLNLKELKHYVELELRTSLISDFIYLNSNSVPEQKSGIINVNSVFLKKEIHFGKLFMINNLGYQNISHKQILSLPDLVFQNSTYINFSLFDKNMLLQLGFDLFYTTKYNIYSYNPSISMFYLNDKNIQSGNYPIINPSLKMKLKSSLTFIQIEHVNANLLADYYSHINNYPIPEYYVRFGIKWWFKN